MHSVQHHFEAVVEGINQQRVRHESSILHICYYCHLDVSAKAVFLYNDLSLAD